MNFCALTGAVKKLLRKSSLYPRFVKTLRSVELLLSKADKMDWAGRWKRTAAMTARTFQDAEHLASTIPPGTDTILALGHMAAMDSSIGQYLNGITEKMPGTRWILLSETPRLRSEEIAAKIHFPFLILPRIPAYGGFDVGLHPQRDFDRKRLRLQPWLLEAAENMKGRFPEMERDYAVFLAQYFSSYCEFVLELVHPRCVIIWNPFLPFHSIMRQVCQEKEIPCAFMEFGALGGTWALDLLRNEGESGTTADTQNFESAVSDKEFENARRVCEFLRCSGLNRNPQKDTRHRTAIIKTHCKKGRPVIVYFGQSDYESGISPYTETSKKLHSPVYENSDAALSSLAQICRQSGWTLIYKPHPEMLRRGLRTKVPPGVMLAQYENIFELIELADVIVTIASQCSYESLIREVPVVMLGYNQLRGKGCAYEAYERDALQPTLFQAIQNKFTEQQRHAFYRHIAHLLKYALYDDQTQRAIRYGQSPEQFINLLNQTRERVHHERH